MHTTPRSCTKVLRLLPRLSSCQHHTAWVTTKLDCIAYHPCIAWSTRDGACQHSSGSYDEEHPQRNASLKRKLFTQTQNLFPDKTVSTPGLSQALFFSQSYPAQRHKQSGEIQAKCSEPPNPFLLIWEQSNIYNWSHVANVAAYNSPWLKEADHTSFCAVFREAGGRCVCLCSTQGVGRALGTPSEGHPYAPPHSITCLALLCSYGTPAQRRLVVTEAHTRRTESGRAVGEGEGPL